MIEDIRKVMQDFLAPELHAMRVKLEMLEVGQRKFRTDVLKQFEQADYRQLERFAKAQEDTKTLFQKAQETTETVN